MAQILNKIITFSNNNKILHKSMIYYKIAKAILMNKNKNMMILRQLIFLYKNNLKTKF